MPASLYGSSDLLLIWYDTGAEDHAKVLKEGFTIDVILGHVPARPGSPAKEPGETMRGASVEIDHRNADEEEDEGWERDMKGSGERIRSKLASSRVCINRTRVQAQK